MLPDVGHGLHHRHRRRQGRRVGDRRAARRPRLPRRRDGRHGARDPRHGRARRRGAREDRRRGAPNVIDCIEAGEVDLIINTPTGSGARADGWEIRRAAVARGIPCITTLSGGHAAARAIAARARRRAERAVAAGDPPRALEGRVTRVQAPFGRRRVQVTGVDDVGAYRVLHAADLDGPQPWPGQFYMLAAARALGGGRGRAALPAARAVVPRRRRRPAELHARGRRARHAPPVRAARRRRAVADRSAGHRASRRRTTAVARSSPAAASASRRWRPGRACSTRATSRSRAVLGFRDAHHAEGARLLGAGARRRGRHRRRLGRPPRPRHRPARRAARRRRPRRRLRVRSAARCSRPCARCAPRAACPAQLALEAGMACGFGACFGCVVAVRDGGYVRVCVDGPVLDADRLDARAGTLIDFCGIAPRAPDRQRLGDLRRDRRAARVRRRAARRVSVQRLRLQDDHAAAARGQPAAAAVGGAGGA